MSENQEGKATGENERMAMLKDLMMANHAIAKAINPDYDKWTWKIIRGRRYRCKREERANDSGIPTGDDLALCALLYTDEDWYNCYKRIKEIIDSHPDGKFNYLAKYLPENNSPQQESNVNNQQEESATMPRQSVKNTAPEEEKPTTIQPKEDKSLELEERKREEQRAKWREAKKRQASKPLYPPELMSVIDAIESYASLRSAPKVDIIKVISKTNNSAVLTDVMLKAASRIRYLQNHPKEDEASPEYDGGEKSS